MHSLAFQCSHHTQMSSHRDDPWTMLDKCRIVTGLRLSSKEGHPTIEDLLLEDHPHQDREVLPIATSPAKDHLRRTLTLCNIEEAALRPCSKASRSRPAEVPMVHHYNNRGRILILEVCSVVIQIQIRFLNILRLYVQAIWEERLVNQPSRRLFAIIRMHRAMLIIDRCRLINLPSRLLDKIWIGCGHL